MHRLLLLGAALLMLPLGAQAQGDRRVDISGPATVAPDVPADQAYVAPIVEALRIEAGLSYGHHNRPGSITAPPNRDTYGYFDPEEPLFSAVEVEPYEFAAFAGAIAGDDRLYYVRQPAEGPPEVLGWYDFDAQEQGPEVPYTMFDADGNELDYADLPQWVDGGVDMETGEIILLGRFARTSQEYGCTAGHGASLFALDPATAQGRFLMHFTDENACPLSGAYDNENNRYVGMVPFTDGTGELIQVDLTTGATVATLPLPSDIIVANFIQSGATDYGDDNDPTNNEAWLFIFQDSAPGAQQFFSTARRADFNASGVITGLTDFGRIDDSAAYVEVLTAGFKNDAPFGVANEPGAVPQSFEFIGAFPNPFRSAATVMLRTAEPVDHATVKVFDLLGREVAVLHDGPLSASTHHIALDATSLPSGVYVVNVQSGSFSQTQKVTLFR